MSLTLLKPEEKRIDLGKGSHIVVKKELTIKEWNIAERKQKDEGNVAFVAMFLVDGTFTDPEGKPVAIAEKSYEEVIDVLNGLPAFAYFELDKVVGTHMISAKEVDEKRKKDQSTKTGATTTKRSSASVA